MYLHHLLNRSEDELIRKFYMAQKTKSSKGDWVKLVEENLRELDITLSNEEISKLSKPKFSKIVQKCITKVAFEELMQLKDKHTKMAETQYENMSMQTYLKCNNGLTDEEKLLLLKFRTRMVEVRCNYKNKL